MGVKSRFGGGMNISVVVPVYNSADTLEALVQRLGDVLPKVAENYELVLVNDGSPDNSWDVIQVLVQKNAWVTGIGLMRNYGQHNALLCGVRAAVYEVIITIDDDLQNPPEEIPVILEKLNQGYDIVFGIPKKMPHSWWRNITSVLTKYFISYVMGFKGVRDISSYRAFRTHLRDAFADYRGSDVLLDVLLSWGSSRVGTVPVEEAPRAVGNSNYNFQKLVKMALTMLTSYTTVPLRLASILGFVFTIIGFIVLVYILTIYFTVGSIPGFPFLASTVIIFSGVQLFALGIIGEYLARVFERTTGRPTYQVLSRVGSQPRRREF
jgi:glycosyltransferase involved in cell wall biosynthesis